MNQLPDGWAWSTLEELIGSGLFADGDWVESKDQDPEGEVRLVQLADIGVGHFRDRSDRHMTREAAARLNCTYIEEGDVLVARMPDPLGRACRVPRLEQPAVTAVDVCILRPMPSGVDPAWLMWTINSPQVRSQILALQSGSTRKRISRTNLSTVHVAVPPRAQQVRIVAAIEEYLARLDAAEAALTSGLDRLSRFEEVIYDQALIPAAPRVPLGQVARTTSGGTPKRTRTDLYGGTIPWIKSGELGDGIVTSTEETITEGALKESSAKLIPQGTVLIAMYGATIGKLGRVGAPAAATNQAVAAMFPSKDLDSDYLWNVLRALRSDLVRLGKGGAQPNISQSILRELEIPLPTREEQADANEAVERSASVFAKTLEVAHAAVRRSASLRRSILAAGVSGRLATQDPNDQPASVLLKQIRADRTGAMPTRRSRKVKTP